MRKLIRADMDRILRKRGFFLIAVFVLIIIPLCVVMSMQEAYDLNFAFTVGFMDGIDFLGIVSGFFLVLSIYVDEFKSMSFIGVIGRGITRKKLILARFLDTWLILFFLYGEGAVIGICLKLLFGVKLTSLMILYIFLACAGALISTVISVMIAAAFFYLTENMPLGMIVYMMFDFIIPLTMELIIMIPTVAKFHPDRLYYTGVISSVMSDFLMGGIGEGLFKLLLVLLIYLGGALSITIFLFKKKELDF